MAVGLTPSRGLHKQITLLCWLGGAIQERGESIPLFHARVLVGLAGLSRPQRNLDSMRPSQHGLASELVSSHESIVRYAGVWECSDLFFNHVPQQMPIQRQIGD